MNNQSSVPIGGNHTKTVRNLLVTLAEVIKATVSALDRIQISINTTACVMMSDCFALDFLLTSHGEVCAIVNTSCTWEIGKVEQGIYYFVEKVIWLSVSYGYCFIGLG